MKEVSDDWLKLVEKALEKTSQLPSLEENFPFPWADASHAIGAGLKLDLTLSGKSAGWKNHEESLQGLGEKVFLVSVEMTPIQGAVFFAMSENGVSHMTDRLLLEAEHKEGISNAKLREGFYHFLFLKALEAIDHLKIFKDVSFHFSTHLPVPIEDAFCIDIDCALSEKTLHGRLICPQSFLNAFKTFQPMQKGSLLSSSEHIDLTLRCEIGHTCLSQDEWDTIEVGDFLILDRCSYDPSQQKGSATLMLGSTALLIVRMKSEGMKILDFALYQEEPSLSPADLTLTAELGHLSMPLTKLLHLEPGAMIDLNMSPEQGVDLTLSGKKVAKGELLKLGETVGLRILEIIE